MQHFNSLNIIYICTSDKGPSGGAKTIYNHSDLINKLNIANLTSEILHIKKKKFSKWNSSIKKIFKFSESRYYGWNTKDITISKGFKSKWFKNNIKSRDEFKFSKEKDFVIFPEIFAHFAKKLCIQNGISYAIFVQNGYSLNSTGDKKTLKDVYKNAKFILSYSKDITKCINLAFKNCNKKILKINISINPNKFNTKIKKKNVITYMPRKLSTHSDNLVFFIKSFLPKNWKLKPMHNLNEKQIFYNLSRSKIFLSFSNMEGLGIPPIEAAIAGNKVIGYHGRGGLEYWRKPIFTEIQHGNISKFIDEILFCIKKKNLTNNLKKYKKKIIKQFSAEIEKKHIINMIKKIRSN